MLLAMRTRNQWLVRFDPSIVTVEQSNARIMLSVIPIMLRICSIFDLWNKSLNSSYESNFLLDWFSGTSDASLSLKTWRRIAYKFAYKFDKFDKIDNNNLKIDNCRLLTKYPFIDFYRFPIQLTNFYRFYQLLSIIAFISAIEHVRLKATVDDNRTVQLAITVNTL